MGKNMRASRRDFMKSFAIARDITFLNSKFLPDEIEELFQQFESGKIEVNPKSLEAARLLAAILLST